QGRPPMAPAAPAAPAASPDASHEIPRADDTPSEPQIPAAPTAPDAPAVAAPQPDASTEAHSVTDSAVRVDVNLLDGLMTLVGELVLARNQILERTALQQDPELFNTAQRLDSITTELQEGIMRTRMQPIGTLWVKYPRMVRDLAIECGKEVRLRTDGEDTELD